MSAPSATVVVPTRNRVELLQACLAALAAQTIADELEIVVVDDGSARVEDVERVVRAAGARLVAGEGRGPAAARNRGVAVAAGPVILLTDDDCLPSEGWAESLCAGLAEHGGVVRGTTLPARPGEALLLANEIIVDQLARWSPFAPTSNLACARDLLLAEPFDERFKLAAGEDREWCMRLSRAGCRFSHRPDAIVLHDATMGLREFWARHERYGRGAKELVARSVIPPRTRSGFALHRAMARAGFREGLRVGGAVVLAQVATAAGYALARPRG